MKTSRITTVVAFALLGAFALYVIVAVGQGRRTAEKAADQYSAEEMEEALRTLFPHQAKDTSGGPEAWLPNAGKTPEATLRAYFYYKDRGQFQELRAFVAQNSLSMIANTNSAGMRKQAQEARGIVVDHSKINGDEATFYFRSWFSEGTRRLGGRTYVGRLVREDGVWKADVRKTMQLTLSVSRGKTKLGFYDGTEEWWKEAP